MIFIKLIPYFDPNYGLKLKESNIMIFILKGVFSSSKARNLKSVGQKLNKEKAPFTFLVFIDTSLNLECK